MTQLHHVDYRIGQGGKMERRNGNDGAEATSYGSEVLDTAWWDSPHAEILIACSTPTSLPHHPWTRAIECPVNALGTEATYFLRKSHHYILERKTS